MKIKKLKIFSPFDMYARFSAEKVVILQRILLRSSIFFNTALLVLLSFVSLDMR